MLPGEIYPQSHNRSPTFSDAMSSSTPPRSRPMSLISSHPLTVGEPQLLQDQPDSLPGQVPQLPHDRHRSRRQTPTAHIVLGANSIQRRDLSATLTQSVLNLPLEAQI